MADNLFASTDGYSNADLIQQVDINGNRLWGTGGRLSKREITRNVTIPAICPREPNGIYIATVLNHLVGGGCYVALDVFNGKHQFYHSDSTGDVNEIVYNDWPNPIQVSPTYDATGWNTVPYNVQMVKDSESNLWIGWTNYSSLYHTTLSITKYDGSGNMLVAPITFSQLQTGTVESKGYKLQIDSNNDIFIEYGNTFSVKHGVIKISSMGTTLFNVELPEILTEDAPYPYNDTPTLTSNDCNGCVDNIGGYYLVGKYGSLAFYVIHLYHIDETGTIGRSPHYHTFSDLVKVCLLQNGNIMVYNLPNSLVLGIYTMQRLIYSSSLVLLSSSNTTDLHQVGILTNIIPDNVGGFYIGISTYNHVYIDHVTSDGTLSWELLDLISDGVAAQVNLITDNYNGIICVWYRNIGLLHGQRVNIDGRKLWEDNHEISNLGDTWISWLCWGKVIDTEDTTIPEWPSIDVDVATSRTLDIHFSKLHLKQGFN